MGLKETLKQTVSEPEPQSKAEDLNLIQNLTDLLEQSKQKIATLQSKNSMLQSENQKLKSAVTTATEQVESLTNRAASVNETEVKNQELLRKAQEAKTESDKALQQAQQERKRAEEASANAEAERRSAQAEAEKRTEAEKKAETAEWKAYDSQSTYRNLFIGNVIFTVALAVLMLYDRRSVLKECGQWFIDRGDNIKGFALWIKSIYIGAVSSMGVNWGLPSVWGYVIATVISLVIAVVLFVLILWLFEKIGDIILSIAIEYEDGVFKGTISADIALVLFFVCLWFYEPIKAALHLNIFSLWLIFSIIGYLIWNGKEIVMGIKSAF